MGGLGTGLERFYYRFAIGLPRRTSISVVVALAGTLVLFWLSNLKIQVLLSFIAYIFALFVLRVCSGAKIATIRRLLWLLILGVSISVGISLTGSDPARVMSTASILPFFVCLGFSGSPACILSLGVVFPLYFAGKIYAIAYLVGLAVASTSLLLMLPVFSGTLKPFRIVVAHLRAWLADDYGLVENLFSCEKRRTLSHITTYKLADGSCMSVVIPGVHFGPFRSAGSSSLPYEIEDGCNNSVAVLHGVLDHSYNVSKVKDSREYARLIIDTISRACRLARNSRTMMMREKRLGEFRIMSIPSILPIMVIDRPGLGIDDIVVWYDGIKYPMVDAHNETVVDWGGILSVKHLEKDITKLYSDLHVCTNLRVSLIRKRVDENEARKLGLCRPELKLLYIDCDGSEWAYLIAPSNNARCGARENVEKILALNGVKGTLLTIDDHVCAGLEPGIPAREFTYDKSLAAILKELLEEARRAAKLVIGVSYEVVEKDVVVWGKCYEELLKYMRKGKIAVTTFLCSLVAGLLAGLFWP